jgi:AcrR family transcriptional regulator
MEGQQVTTLRNEAARADEVDRPMRADAKRNQERLIVAARAVFAQQGGSASMEAIAKEAGVGVGTLYRHFPKRIDVVEAVYRTDVDGLVAAADGVATLEPWEALRSWLRAFVVYARGKRTFLNELHEAFEKNPDLKSESRQRIEQALSAVLTRAQLAGEVRDDVSGGDLMQLLGTMCMSVTLTEEQGDRLMTMILDGLRHQHDVAERVDAGPHAKRGFSPLRQSRTRAATG